MKYANTKNIKTINGNKKNNLKNNVYKYFLYGITIFISLIILFSLLFTIENGIKTIIDNDLSISNIFFGKNYTPIQGVVSLGFIVFNTIWMTFLAILIATPISIGISLLITRKLSERSSMLVYSMVAILSAIPSVIYGAFGYYVIDNFSTNILGFQEASLLQ